MVSRGGRAHFTAVGTLAVIVKLVVTMMMIMIAELKTGRDRDGLMAYSGNSAITATLT